MFHTSPRVLCFSAARQTLAVVLLAAALLAACGRSSVGDSQAEKLIPQLKAGGDAAARANAAAQLGTWRGTDPTRVAGALGQALGDPRWEVRQAAGQALEKLGPQGAPARAALIRAMGDEVFYVGLFARNALAAQGAAALPAVLKAARGPEGSIHDNALGALLMLAPVAGKQAGQAVEAIAPSLASPRMHARFFALQALLPYTESAPEAAERAAGAAARLLTATTETLRTRVAALQALANLARAGKLNGAPAQALAGAAHDANPAVREAARQALAAGTAEKSGANAD